MNKNFFSQYEHNRIWIGGLVLLTIGLLGFFLLPFPLPTHAANHPGLVTCGLMSGSVGPCTICDLITLFQTLVSQANSYFALPLAALMLGYGGFLMVLSGFQGGKPSLFAKGKTVITNAIVGIVIIFCSWIAIDTLLKIIGGYQHASASNFGPWHVIECVSPVVKWPKHFECNGDKCEEVDGYSIAGCTEARNCGKNAEHLGCDDKGMCVWIKGEGANTCTEGEDPKCKKSTHPGNLCQGVECPDKDFNTPIASLDCLTDTINNQWGQKVSNVTGRMSNPGDVDLTKMVKAVIFQESKGNIAARSEPDGDGKRAFGLMQIKVKTANIYRNRCGVNIVFNEDNAWTWFRDPANAEAQICIGAQYLADTPGLPFSERNVRNLSAYYNGGPEALQNSANCTSCNAYLGQEGETRRWACLWDDNAHTQCNANKQGGNFANLRKEYIPRVTYCYGQF